MNNSISLKYLLFLIMVVDIKKIRGGWAQTQSYRKTQTNQKNKLPNLHSNDIFKTQPKCHTA